MISILGRSRLVVVAASAVALAACDSIKNVSDDDFSSLPTPNVVLRGQVTGITSSPLVLTAQYVAGSDYVGSAAQGSIVREVTKDGAVSFAAIPQNAQYTVSVTSLPIGKLCNVANGTGTAAENVTNVTVTCIQDPDAPTYKISGSVVGLSATGLQLKLVSPAGEETVDVAAGGTSFAFNSELLTDFDYEVSIATSPQVPGAGGAPSTTHQCALANDSGTIVDSNITDVEVKCGFEVGGRIYALGGVSLAGLTLALELPGPTADLSLTDAEVAPPAFPGAPATFSFASLLPSHVAANYKLAVTAQPAGSTCVVGNGGYVSLTTPADAPTGVLLQCVPVPAAPLTGTYKTAGRTFITFLEDGTFLSGTRGATAAESGAEHGVYLLDGFGPGSLVLYTATDANGAGGVSNPTSGAGIGWPFGYLGIFSFAQAAGPPAQITGLIGVGGPPTVPFSITAVESSAGPQGAWVAGNRLSALVFETSGGVDTATYYSADNMYANAFGQAPPPQLEDLCVTGIDMNAATGTYTQDRSGACLAGGVGALDIPNPATSTDIWAATYGQPGAPAFGAPAAAVNYTVTGDSLSLVVPGPPPTVFTRSAP